MVAGHQAQGSRSTRYISATLGSGAKELLGRASTVLDTTDRQARVANIYTGRLGRYSHEHPRSTP